MLHPPFVNALAVVPAEELRRSNFQTATTSRYTPPPYLLVRLLVLLPHALAVVQAEELQQGVVRVLAADNHSM